MDFFDDSKQPDETGVEARSSQEVIELHDALRASFLALINLECGDENADAIATPIWREFVLDKGKGSIHVDNGTVVIVTSRADAISLFGNEAINDYDRKNRFIPRVVVVGLHEDGFRIHGVRRTRSGDREEGIYELMEDTERTRGVFEAAVEASADSGRVRRQKTLAKLGRTATR